MPAAPTSGQTRWTEPIEGCSLAQADWLDAAGSLEPGSIDLIYADPPFNTGATKKSHAGAFDDRWPTTEGFIGWLRDRLSVSVPLLKPTGSILLHLDWRSSHRARIVLDDLLCEDRFVNHLVWTYGLGGSSPRRFARKHDDILFYCVDPDRYWFEPPMVPATSRRMQGQLKKATDVLDIPSLNNQAKERVGWPTQKPLQLLEMLIGACCPEGGTVFDPCCGSGTTLVAASNLNRFAVGSDLDEAALAITTQRLTNPLRTPR